MTDNITLPRADAKQVRSAIRVFYNKYSAEAAHEDAGRAIAALDAALAESDAIAAKYNELLMAVWHKYPGETRHETALRYITQAEQRITVADQAKEVKP
jgi:hypothetical protein